MCSVFFNISYLTIYKVKEINVFFTIMSRICIVFAGREDRMQILMHYLNKALKEKKLDEIHLWNYSRNDSDTTWVNSLKSDKINNNDSKSYIK